MRSVATSEPFSIVSNLCSEGVDTKISGTLRILKAPGICDRGIMRVQVGFGFLKCWWFRRKKDPLVCGPQVDKTLSPAEGSFKQRITSAKEVECLHFVNEYLRNLGTK